jgi:polar amino acid transport system substrate-binding protein
MKAIRFRPTAITSSGAAAVLVWVLIGATPALADRLEQIRERQALRLGYHPEARPFSYEDENGKPEGYSVELCARVADAVKKELGLDALKIEFVPITVQRKLEPMEAQQLDVFCGAVATLERRETFAFSIPIFPSGIGALLRGDSPERLNAVLEGREVPYRPNWRVSMGQVLEKRVLSAQAGTAAEGWLRGKRDEFKVNAEIVPVRSYQEGVERVLDGRSDVMFGDRAALLNTAARSSSPGELHVLTRIFTHQPVALVLPRGDESFRLLVDRTLSRLYRSGEIQDIYSRFFGRPDTNALALFAFAALPE